MFGSNGGGASMLSAHFRLLTLLFLFAVCLQSAVESTRQYEVVDGSDLVSSVHKRGGARAFVGPRASIFSDGSFLYPSAKSGVMPYYFYESQPKRGGGRAFNSYWNSGFDGKRLFDDYRKRSSFDDYV
ncbi:hypothetical protein QR680_005354 [Steinernema hermaphroditum]|uniref:Uncharacterized protein n=1 Tax=Steinernema hermaphroditum TaxID=289476 RepID=A0AA39LVH3_9BILA|nr:hypothetical protein QR680_005354 [Steinernema hermaphroditum]